MGYSGNASFVFEVERYLNKQTNQLMFLDQAEAEAKNHPFGDTWFDMNYEYQCIPLDIEGRSYFQEGRTSGLPENCYPDEGETEITSVIGPTNEDWESKLSQSETNSIMEMIQDQVTDGAGDYEPDDDHDDYDDRDYYDDGDGDY